jgi:hypothetical protein
VSVTNRQVLFALSITVAKSAAVNRALTPAEVNQLYDIGK